MTEEEIFVDLLGCVISKCIHLVVALSFNVAELLEAVM